MDFVIRRWHYDLVLLITPIVSAMVLVQSLGLVGAFIGTPLLTLGVYVFLIWLFRDCFGEPLPGEKPKTTVGANPTMAVETVLMAFIMPFATGDMVLDYCYWFLRIVFVGTQLGLVGNFIRRSWKLGLNSEVPDPWSTSAVPDPDILSE